MTDSTSTKITEKDDAQEEGCLDGIKIVKEGDEEETINDTLKNIKNEDRETCFPLLDCYFLNKGFQSQDLEESIQVSNNVNEYINMRLLKKEIYPKDAYFEIEKNNREKLIQNILKLKDKKNESDIIEEKKDLKNELRMKTSEEISMIKNVPSYWKNDTIVGTFNPVYNAREKVMDEQFMDTIPTIDVFYNSSKLLTVQTIFEPISHYIFLLRLLPHFCLPLYDSGIVQFVCEDAFLNPKFKGLEISYRLLIHDILFYAFFSYLADLPFWAKPPIRLLRIYNYESLCSFNDWESVHTERLVFHNIRSILLNFADTISKIELLYPANYYITVFPNIYFKSIIDFLRSEGFKLKKIVVVIKGTKYIDEKMMNEFRLHMKDFKGMTTETIQKEDSEKLHFSDYDMKEIKSTKRIIRAMKKCRVNNINTKEQKYMNLQTEDKKTAFDKIKKEELLEIISSKEKEEDSSNGNQKKEDRHIHFQCNEVNPNQIENKTDHSNEKNLIEMKEPDSSVGTNSNETENKKGSHESYQENQFDLKSIDLSNSNKMDDALYKMYYEKKEDNEMNDPKEGKFDKANCSSSEFTYTEDESDDENIDGFFKSKKIRSTVYDKKDFSFSKIMNNIIHFEKIIDYLYNDEHYHGDSSSRVKFYVKMLLFEKTYEENLNDDDSTREADFANTSNNNYNNNHDSNNNNNNNNRSENTNINNNANESSNITDESYQNDRQSGINASDEHNAEGNTSMNDSDNPTENTDNTISIRNLIRNLRLTFERNNFLPFSQTDENTGENVEEPSGDSNFNLQHIQDSLTRITFNFN